MKITRSEIKGWRDQLLAEQGGRCALCGLPIQAGQDALDHSHKTGHIRGVLHRSCNALLGKVENNYKRMGVSEISLSVISPLIHNYINADYSGMPLHPSFKTEEEKRLARNAKARKKRARCGR